MIPGAEVMHVPNVPGVGLLEALPKAIEACPKRPVALILNYPCNPDVRHGDAGIFTRRRWTSAAIMECM